MEDSPSLSPQNEASSSPGSQPSPSSGRPQNTHPGAAAQGLQDPGAGQWNHPPQPLYVAQQTNGKAIASMVLGILWLYCIGSVLALVLGYTAKREIASSGGAQAGGGMATAGIVLGWIGVGFFGLLFLIFLVNRL